MQSSDDVLSAQQQRCDKEQVFVACKLAVAQSIAACRSQLHAFPSSPAPVIKVTVRGGSGSGSAEVRGEQAAHSKCHIAKRFGSYRHKAQIARACTDASRQQACRQMPTHWQARQVMCAAMQWQTPAGRCLTTRRSIVFWALPD